MMPLSIISVREHQVLTAQAHDGLSQAELDWLINQNFLCFTLISQQGQVALKVRHYLGLIRLPTGRLLEILPKVGVPNVPHDITEKTVNELAHTRAWVARMLNQLVQQTVDIYRPIEAIAPQQVLSTQKQLQSMPVVLALVQEFLTQLHQVISFGLHTDYHPQTQNTACLQGKLLLKEQVQHNLHQPLRFYHEASLRQANTAVNRVLKTALVWLQQLPWIEAQTVQAYLAGFFAQLPTSTSLDDDKIQAQHDCVTLPACYARALQLAVFLLESPVVLPSVGGQLSQSLLFNMQHCFEQWVSLCLQYQLHHYQLVAKPTQVFLRVDNSSQPCVTLQPDVVLKQQNKISHIIDVKWKQLASPTGIQPQDAYQLLAYAQGFASQDAQQLNTQLWLVYPRTEQFTQVIKLSYQLAQGEQALWLVPFCMEKAQVLL